MNPRFPNVVREKIYSRLDSACFGPAALLGVLLILPDLVLLGVLLIMYVLVLLFFGLLLILLVLVLLCVAKSSGSEDQKQSCCADNSNLFRIVEESVHWTLLRRIPHVRLPTTQRPISATRSQNEPTADQQKENQSDRELTAKVRQALVKDKSLSTYAHNVKIIAQDGIVTLKGPVPAIRFP